VLLNKEAVGTLLFSDLSACNPENVLCDKHVGFLIA